MNRKKHKSKTYNNRPYISVVKHKTYSPPNLLTQQDLQANQIVSSILNQIIDHVQTTIHQSHHQMQLYHQHLSTITQLIYQYIPLNHPPLQQNQFSINQQPQLHIPQKIVVTKIPIDMPLQKNNINKTLKKIPTLKKMSNQNKEDKILLFKIDQSYRSFFTEPQHPSIQSLRQSIFKEIKNKSTHNQQKLTNQMKINYSNQPSLPLNNKSSKITLKQTIANTMRNDNKQYILKLPKYKDLIL